MATLGRVDTSRHSQSPQEVVVRRWRRERWSVLAHLHHPVCHQVDLRGGGQLPETPLVGAGPEVDVDLSEFGEAGF